MQPSAQQQARSNAPPLSDRKRELLAKVKVLREAQRAGPQISGDPTMQYCWVNTNQARQVAFQAMGWEVAKSDKLVTAWKQLDGTHQRADTILYQMPLDLYEAIQADKDLRSIEALEGAELGLTFQETAAKDHVPVFKPSVKG